jgi:hypothetical protein
MVLSVQNQRWGALLGNTRPGQTISQVSVDWIMPSASWHSNGANVPSLCPYEVLAIWAGIDSSGSSSNLWQAGIVIKVYSPSNSWPCPTGVHYTAWYESVSGSCTNCAATQDSGWGDTNVHAGDTMSVTLYYAPANNTGWGAVWDLTGQTRAWSFSAPNLRWPPNGGVLTTLSRRKRWRAEALSPTK